MEAKTQLDQTPAAASEEARAPIVAERAIPLYPKELYDEAHIENGHRDFNDRLRAARAPDKEPPKPPSVPLAVQKQTELEMAAGKARVEHFANIEKDRKGMANQRVPEKWEGKSTPVFRPDDFSEYKPGLKSQAQTPSKDVLRQPPAR